MSKDEVLLERVKKIIEAQLGWGHSSAWVNQDFIALSKSMVEKTGGSLSPVTLKRVWGKVNYSGLPQTYTLNTLAQFAGYESWRDFIVKNENLTPPVSPVRSKAHRNFFKSSLNKPFLIIMLLAICGISYGTLKFVSKGTADSSEFKFSSHTTLNAGIPNSVIFKFDATHAREDSVILQQSWDTRLRRKVSKNDHEATMIYYFPGYFNPKLIVKGNVVKEHGLLIKSNGWITALLDKDIPVYFKKDDVMKEGKMSLPADKIKSQNISMAPKPPVLSFCNVQDFGELYTDDFEFETSVRNDYRSESSVCQVTNIYLLCKGTAINIPLSSKGCESALNFYFTSHEVSGKKNDLSAFGVDFGSFVKVKIRSKDGKANVLINDKLAYVVEQGITRSQIIGIDIAFQGTGSVDYVRLQNQKVKFDDEF
jgi:hypothetical protein